MSKLAGISSEQWQFIIEHEEKLSQGIHLWYKGVPYPRRVYHDKNREPNFFLRTLDSLGIVKKYLFSLTFLKNLVIPRTLSVKKYNTFLRHIFTLVDWTLMEFWIKDEEFSIPVWEIGKMAHRFLWELGLEPELATNYSRLVMMILEFDNAYRYRIQDLFENINTLDRKSLKEILEIYKKRELNPGAAAKINQVGNILNYLLILSKFKKALAKSQQGIDFHKIRLDKNDLYHTSYWVGYEFGGKNWDTRYQVFLAAHPKEFPPYHKRDGGEINSFLLGL